MSNPPLIFYENECVDFVATLDKMLQAKWEEETSRINCWENDVLIETKHLKPYYSYSYSYHDNGLYFAVHCGKEHRQLRLIPCQIKL